MRLNAALLILVTAMLVSGCEKDQGLPESNQGQATITEGAYGTLLFREGNCMPVIDPTVCKEYPVKRKIYFYEATNESEAVPAASHSTFYTTVSSTLVATVETNSTGFFQVHLHPGKYSMFIKEDGKLWANGIDEQDHIMPVTINANALTEKNIVIDYKAVY